jgi:hypothetical protein
LFTAPGHARRLADLRVLLGNGRQLLFWLGLVLLGAFGGRVCAIHAYQLAHR